MPMEQNRLLDHATGVRSAPGTGGEPICARDVACVSADALPPVGEGGEPPCKQFNHA